MKKLTILCLLIASLFACSKKETNNPILKTQKEYKITLGFVGEITESKSPLLANTGSTLPRAVTSNDLLGIQVYSRAQGTTGTYNHFAYGLFDNASGIDINLLSGYEYKFVTTIVVDGKTKIRQINSGYSAPFIIHPSSESGLLTNGFILSGTKYFDYLDKGLSGLVINPTNNWLQLPNTDRYYGETSDYIPTQNNTIQISTKRTVFGAKFVATGLTDGKLKIELKDAPAIYLETTTPQTTLQDIFTFKNVQAAWINDTYTETIPLTITWLKADGAAVPLGTKDIAFQRKMLSTINIAVANTSSSSTVAITQETGELGTGTTTNF